MDALGGEFSKSILLFLLENDRLCVSFGSMHDLLIGYEETIVSNGLDYC